MVSVFFCCACERIKLVSTHLFLFLGFFTDSDWGWVLDRPWDRKITSSSLRLSLSLFRARVSLFRPRTSSLRERTSANDSDDDRKEARERDGERERERLSPRERKLCEKS